MTLVRISLFFKLILILILFSSVLEVSTYFVPLSVQKSKRHGASHFCGWHNLPKEVFFFKDRYSHSQDPRGCEYLLESNLFLRYREYILPTKKI